MELEEYKLVGCEERILEVLLDPECINMTVTDRCKVIGISRNTYYTHMNKPAFNAYCKTLVRSTIQSEVMPLLNAALREAKKGSFHHFKLLMEMGQFHTDEKNLNIDGNMAIEHIVSFGQEFSKNNIIEVSARSDEPEELE